MSLSSFVSVLNLYTVYKDWEKRMPSGQGVIAEGIPVTAAKEEAA